MGCECGDPWDETRPMLECDGCSEWYHGECVPYSCEKCTVKSEEEQEQYYRNLLKEKDTDRQKLKEALDKKIRSLQEKLEENKAKKSGEGDKIQELKTNVTVLRQEKNSLAAEKKDEEKKVRMLTKEKLEAVNAKTKTEEKLKKTIDELQEAKIKSDSIAEKRIEELLKEINNRNREVDIHMKSNRKLKETNEQLRIDIQAIEQQSPSPCDERTEKDGEKENEALDQPALDKPVMTDNQSSKENGLDGEENKHLEEKNEKLKEEMKKMKAKLKIKDEIEQGHVMEIETLKGQIRGYRERLENTLTSQSQIEKEKEHLADSLGSLKAMNLTLNSELEKKNKAHEKREGNVNKSKEGKEKKPCRNSTSCHHWKNNRCKFDHGEDIVDNNNDDGDGQQGKKENEPKEIPNLDSKTTPDETGKDVRESDTKAKRRRMCREGKECQKMDDCQQEHNCNYRVCKHGDKCRYIHENGDNGDPEKATKSCNLGKSCKKRETTCKLNHVCGFLVCDYGERCKYLHEVKRLTRNGEHVSKLLGDNLGNGKDVPCKEGKRCKKMKDNGCSFRHSCKFQSKCTQGHRCRFVHNDDKFSLKKGPEEADDSGKDYAIEKSTEETKNRMEGMHSLEKTLHSLGKEIKEMAKEIQKIKRDQREKS